MERDKQIQEYILTQETFSIIKKLTNGEISSDLKDKTNQYFESLITWIKSSFDRNQITVTAFAEKDIEARLGKKIEDEFTKNPRIVCVCLDRFLLNDIEDEYPNRFFRLQVTRSYNGGKTARQKTPFIETQFDNIVNFLKDRDIVLVDDGIFSGGTSNYVINELGKRGIEKDRIKKFIGFIGNNEKVEGTRTEIIEPIAQMYEWVDIRDFGVFGGKKYEESRNNIVSTSIPYLFPWSDGSSASFDKLGNFFELSKGMITSFKELICAIEIKTNKKIRIRDLIKSGFPIPTNVNKNIPVSLNTPLSDYLDCCIKIIEKEQKRRVYIFDMDGTLYQLDGNDNGYNGSSLKAKVKENAIKFITQIEKVNETEAQTIFSQGENDSIGVSNFLSKRYGITRNDYFDVVWNINPEGIIKNFDIPVKTIKKLAETDIKLILLTSAPKVWQEKVIKYLGLEKVFESVYTGENFESKKEIFKLLSERYLPTNIISIGDQEKTDMSPALNLGMKGFLVNNPNDIGNLLNF